MIHLVAKETDALKQQLLEFEHLDPMVIVPVGVTNNQKPKCMSIGVLYCKEGQTTESEMFGNGTISGNCRLNTGRTWKSSV